MAFKFVLLSSLLASTALSQTVTITKDIPTRDHSCIKDCLYRPYNRRVDVGDALQCAAPYQEKCYCPAENAQAEIVSRHIDSCATESCSRGDVTQDIDKMRAHYATYCFQKGYTVDLVQQWYSALDTVVSTTAQATTTKDTTTATSAAASTGEARSAQSASGPSSTVATSTTASNSVATATSTNDINRLTEPLSDVDKKDAAVAVKPGMISLGVAAFIAVAQYV